LISYRRLIIFNSTTHPSPVGIITLASNSGNLVGLWLEGQKYHGLPLPEDTRGRNTRESDISVFEKTKKWLDTYFAGGRPAISELPLAPAGGAFRQGVWDILREIPYGTVITYGEIARKIAIKMNRTRMSAQAVGGAVGHNPISIIIPCHRVVGADGSLTGYAGGINTKIKLLTLEHADMSKLYVPRKGTAL
jgi:methylated-DNA-[protein]-cysteine S-methyltransferase